MNNTFDQARKAEEDRHNQREADIDTEENYHSLLQGRTFQPTQISVVAGGKSNQDIRLYFGALRAGVIRYGDLEIGRIMEAYPPVPVTLDMSGQSPYFRPVEHDYWDNLWGREPGTHPIPVTPFCIVMINSYAMGEEFYVQWWTWLDTGQNSGPVRCQAYLNHRDPAKFETNHIRGMNGRIQTYYFGPVPFVAEPYKLVHYSQPKSPDPNKPNLYYVVYWPWPADEQQVWANAVDTPERREVRL